MQVIPKGQSAIEPARLEGILTFLQTAEQLKDTLRSGCTRRGRVESTAASRVP